MNQIHKTKQPHTSQVSRMSLAVIAPLPVCLQMLWQLQYPLFFSLPEPQQQPARTTEDIDRLSRSNTDVDARIALKIVQERASALRADGETEDANNLHPNKGATSNTPPENLDDTYDGDQDEQNQTVTTQRQQQFQQQQLPQRQPTAPGAVRVAGIQTTGSSSDGFGADTIRFGDSLTSQQTPILEAMLVQSTTTPRHPFSHSTLLVSAHPMIVPEDAEGEHSTESENQVELQDEAKNKKLSIMILATIAIFLVIALIVGLSIGLLIPGSDENHHDDDATTTSTPADVTSGVPFTTIWMKPPLILLKILIPVHRHKPIAGSRKIHTKTKCRWNGNCYDSGWPWFTMPQRGVMLGFTTTFGWNMGPMNVIGILLIHFQYATMI